MSACFGTQRVMPDTMPPDPAKHVNYVRGMVLEVDEFKQEFAYHAGRDRSLAREAIGYGTLRGLALGWVKDTNGKLQPSVLVKAGIALSPCGQLICVGSDQCADINQWLAGRTNEISAKFAAGATIGELVLHVTLAYSDCPTDDAPVPGEPCRSEQDLMQPSRITDSFQLELSYEAPLQAEEDALRGFYAWLRKLNIVPDSSAATSVAMDVFMAEVRAWDVGDTDPESLTIRASDVPDYSTVALRLWVTELRSIVERSGAKQRFKIWLNSVPINATTLATEQEFLAQVHRWTPRTVYWPGNFGIDEDNKDAFIETAIGLWDSIIAPKWYTEPCGCRAPNNPEFCDDRLLLGTLKFTVEKTASNSWRVVIPATVSATSPIVDESLRPILANLRALEAQLIPTPEPGTGSLIFRALTHIAPYRRVALGRVKHLPADATPAFGNVRITSIKDGEVRFTFVGYNNDEKYKKPDIAHDYVVQVLASYTGNKSEPAVRFVEFDVSDFVYKVTRSNKGIPAAELETMEFQVEVSIIVLPN